MKTIHLIRHAKSSWGNSRLSDEDRPLASRGINDCKIMASHLIEAGWNYQNIFCSHAQRARMTVQGISDALPDISLDWQVDPDLYTFSSEVLFDWFEALDGDIDEVTVVGHNPALTDLINQISDSQLSNLPTCAYIQLKSTTGDWRELVQSEFKTVLYLKPKMFKI